VIETEETEGPDRINQNTAIAIYKAEIKLSRTRKASKIHVILLKVDEVILLKAA
jgi:hypothetical protein